MAGLDTRLMPPVAQDLVSAMRDSGLPASSWEQAVAPHCHHYKTAVDRIVLQYPPGTGFLMSLAPDGIEQRTLRLGSFTMAVLALLALGFSVRHWQGAALLAIAGAATFQMLAKDIGSPSAAPSVALGALLGLGTVTAARSSKVWPFLLLGLLTGLATAVRLPNLFFGIAPGIFLAVRLLQHRRGRDLAGLGCLLAGTLIGLLPVLIANQINAGSILATTYASVDANTSLSLETLRHGLDRLFLSTDASSSLSMLAAVICAAALPTARMPAVAAICAFIALLAFLASKPIVLAYYLAPLSAFAICGVLAAEVRPRALFRGVGMAALPAAALAIWYASAAFPLTPYPVDSAVQEKLGPNTIVWGDVFSGYYVMESDAYSAKIVFASQEVQDRLIQEMQERGVTQLISDSTGATAQLVERLKPRLTFLGQAYGQNVYQLDAN